MYIDARVLKERILENYKIVYLYAIFPQSLKGAVGIISSGPSFKRGACPIYNGTI